MIQPPFKIIALRILKGCAPDIHKCLHIDMFYYLCNDYVISEDGTTIKRASSYIEPVADDFFSINEKNSTLSFHLQAIVGKNGDGKSSLIDIILRLINNFAYSKKIGNNENITIAKGLCAEMYYQLNGSFYCLQEADGDVNNMTLRSYKYDANQSSWTKSVEVTQDELKQLFFYTIVSNYSHYSYNTLEYKNESDGSDDSDCWLHNIFHKNDAYQAPITLHPFRVRGNIDMNRERELTKPRLVSTFVKSMVAADKRKETFKFNGKELVGLRLKDIGYSKFQKKTLLDYFEENKHTYLLHEEIEYLRSIDTVNIKDDDVSMVVGYTESLKNAYQKYFSHANNKKLYDLAKDWINDKEQLIDANNDIATLIDLLEKLAIPLLGISEATELSKICAQWREYTCFNLAQIQWLDFIDDICDQWRHPGIILGKDQIFCIEAPPELLFKNYDELNDREKCIHYIIYKTINVFQTYESYGKPAANRNKTPFFFSDNLYPKQTFDKWENATISRTFAKLSQDWLYGSHITLKLRQTYNFFKDGDDSTYMLYPPKSAADTLSDDTLFFANFSEQDKLRIAIKEYLPPAIYYWDIVFSTNGNLVAMDSFSSGEKQRLFGLSAIIYHLQNVDSIATEKFHYEHINIVLEEVELYYHPEWQRSFCYDLMSMIREAGLHQIKSVNMLFVTHSPYILSDIPKTNVLFLKDGHPEYSMQENTFGANINSLLKNGFFMPGLPMGTFAHTKINDLFAKLHSGNFSPDELSQIRSEILMVGEPYIRQQLMTLYNMFTGVSKAQIREIIKEMYRHD